MRTILCLQRFRASTPQRQEELDHCLAQNRRHPALAEVVLWMEPDAPPPPPGPVPVSQRPLARRLLFSDWLGLAAACEGAIVVLANADIALGEGFLQLARFLSDRHDALALTRREAASAERGSRLEADPHWRQDLWAIRSDGPIDPDLVAAAALPIGRPGSDNRIAHVLWSHGLRLHNPALHLQALHHQRLGTAGYDRHPNRLLGACTYVHPCLAPGDPSELEHVLWSRQPERSGGLLVQVEPEQGEGGEQPYWAAAALGAGLRASAAATPFADRQALAALRRRARPLASHGLAVSAPAGAAVAAAPASAETLVLPLEALGGEGCRLTLLRPATLLGVALRLPLAQPGGGRLRLAFGLAAAGSGGAVGAPPALVLPVGAGRAGGGLLLPGAWPAQPIAWLTLVLEADGAGPERAEAGEAFLEVQLLVAPGTATAEPVARWGERFELALEAGALVARDRFWPTSQRSLGLRGATPAAWFPQLFAPPLLEWKPDWIPRRPGHPEALLHWQRAPQEAEARDRHAALAAAAAAGAELPWSADLDGGPVATYIGLPWRSFLRAGAVPERLLQAYADRLQAMAAVLAASGRALRVHSVCEAPGWLGLRSWWRELGLSDLWLVQPPGVEELAAAQADGLQLHAWPALPAPATNLADWADRPVLLEPAPPADDDPAALHARLGHCRFALCPGGAEADPAHLWRVLAAGAVPVVLGEAPWRPEAAWLLPGHPQAWQAATIPWSGTPDGALADGDLADRLAAIEPLAWRSRQLLGARLLRAAQRRPCFGSAAPAGAQG
ncbi:MAG: hypothetical protein VKK43_07600 [Synechococcaceae cyanobacterium]|nr:hypothetical protein [Synechococcaceae cyanobacterium]